MDGYTALVAIVAMIVTGVTISSIFESLHPSPPLGKFDAINKELKRLHDDLEDYRSAPSWYSEQINTLNQALIAEKSA